MPPRSKASDYAKGKISQDEIIALQIANDANIAAARKAVKMGIVQPLNPLLSASPDELLADDSAQEAMARTNLERIGFRPQEAAQIIADIRSDPVLDFTSLNANFPAIEADIKKRFNVKLLTPSFFMNYLSQYKIELDLSRGLSTSGLSGIKTGVSGLVNSVAEILQVLPTQQQMNMLLINANRARVSTQQQNLLTPILERISVLQDALPNPAEYRRIDQLDPVDKQRIIQELQTATADLPSRAQIDALIQQTAGGISSGSVQSLSALANSVPPELQRNLDAIMREIRESLTAQDMIREDIEQVKQLVKTGSEEWEKGDPPILTPEDWNTFTLKSKKLFLRSRFEDEGETLITKGKPAEKLGDITSLNKPDANATFKQWLDDYGYDLAGSMSSSGSAPYNPAASIVSSSTFAPSRVSNITPTGVAETFQPSAGKQGKGVGNQGSLTNPPFRGITYKKEGVRGNVVPSKIGKGVSVKETPSYREYGKYAIHIPQLEQQDMLNVKYK